MRILLCVCNWGGGCAPPTPPLFRGHRCLQKRTSVKSSPPSMLAAGAKNKHLVIAMWIIYVCTRGRLCGSFCLQMGEGCAPPKPPLLKSIDASNCLFFHSLHCFRDHFFHHLMFFASYLLFHSKISHWLPKYSAKKLGGKVENQPAQG